MGVRGRRGANGLGTEVGEVIGSSPPPTTLHTSNSGHSGLDGWLGDTVGRHCCLTAPGARVRFPASGHCLCGVCTFSPCVCVGFLRVAPVSSHTPKDVYVRVDWPWRGGLGGWEGDLCVGLTLTFPTPAALQALKRKKRYEQQLTQIDGTLSTIEFQREALEYATTNTEVLKTMSEAAKAMKTAHNNM